MANNSTEQRESRLMKLGVLGVIGLLVVAFALYWFLFRDTSAASVDSVEAAEARQATIDAAATQETQDSSDDSVAQTAPVPTVEGTDTELDVGQPDSAASVGSASDGAWTIDTSLGTFDQTCLEGACGTTFAGFRINEELASIGAKTVVGRTPNVSGSMELLGSQVVAANFVVDMTTLITDNEARTSALRGPAGGLETNTFPEAIFVLTEPIDLGEVPAEGVSVEVEAVGELTLHGVTRPVTVPLTAELQSGLIIIVGSLEGMLLSDYDIPTPSALVVVSVEDNATMELQLFLSR